MLNNNRKYRIKPLPAPAEQAMEDRNQLYRAYRRQVLADREQMFLSSEAGDMLRKFAATLNHFGADAEPQMLEYIKDQSYRWLRNAPEDIRREAVRLVNERCIRNRLRQNKDPLSDPMPGQPDDIYRICKRELGL